MPSATPLRLLIAGSFASGPRWPMVAASNSTILVASLGSALIPTNHDSVPMQRQSPLPSSVERSVWVRRLQRRSKLASSIKRASPVSAICSPMRSASKRTSIPGAEQRRCRQKKSPPSIAKLARRSVPSVVVGAQTAAHSKTLGCEVGCVHAVARCLNDERSADGRRSPALWSRCELRQFAFETELMLKSPTRSGHAAIRLKSSPNSRPKVRTLAPTSVVFARTSIGLSLKR